MKRTRIIFSAMVEVQSNTEYHSSYEGFAYQKLSQDLKPSNYKGIGKTGTYYFAGTYQLEEGQDILDFVESTWVPNWTKRKRLNISNVEIIKTEFLQ
jgi:hypothetical protein